MSHIWSREEDTLSPSGDETLSDVRALIRETPVKKTVSGEFDDVRLMNDVDCICTMNESTMHLTC
jgi:hypothetical protein